MNDNPKVALFILNYNSKSFLGAVIESCKKQTYRNFKIIVIDNNSADESIDFLKTHYPNIELITNKKNIGVGAGFNKGIKKYLNNFEYMAFFNPDMKIHKHWLKETLWSLENDPQAQTCAGLLTDWQGKHTENAGGIIVNIFTGIFGGFLSGIPIKKLPKQYKNKTFPVFYSTLTSMLVRTNAFKKYGLFDEGYFMSSEEIDFCWRVWMNGGKILCNTKAKAAHYIHGSNPSTNIKLYIFKHTETNILLTYYKNLSTLTFLLLIVPLIIFRLTASLLYIPVSPRITITKLEGILLFFPQMLTKKYRTHRSFISQIKRQNDWIILKYNPTPLFSFTPIYTSMKKWFATIRISYTQSRKEK